MGRPTVLTYVHSMVYVGLALDFIARQPLTYYRRTHIRRDPRGFILQPTVNTFRKRLAARMVLASAGLPGRSGRQRRRQ